MTAFLSCVITCEHLCMCHSELFSLLTNLIFLFCPEPSNHSSRITSLWHIRIHLFIPTLHRRPHLPPAYTSAAQPQPWTPGLQFISAVLNTFYHSFSALNNQWQLLKMLGCKSYTPKQWNIYWQWNVMLVIIISEGVPEQFIYFCGQVYYDSA